MRKTPQIPRDVFFEEPKEEAVKTSKVDTITPAKQSKVKTSTGQKVQVTVYLAEEVAQELERGRYELWAQHQVRAPKSAIVEQAIVQALGDLGSLAAALGAKDDR